MIKRYKLCSTVPPNLIRNKCIIFKNGIGMDKLGKIYGVVSLKALLDLVKNENAPKGDGINYSWVAGKSLDLGCISFRKKSLPQSHLLVYAAGSKNYNAQKANCIKSFHKVVCVCMLVVTQKRCRIVIRLIYILSAHW